MITEKEQLDFLRHLVGQKSVNGNEKDVAVCVAAFLQKHGISSSIHDLGNNRANLTAVVGTSGKTLGLSGHMDVVAAGDREGWQTDPFVLTEKNKRLYGRGVCDMKAGICALVFAFIAQKDLQRGRLKLLLTAGEETDQIGARTLFEQGMMDDVDALVIAEPTGNMFNVQCKGSMNIELTALGKSAHSSMPHAGENAITLLTDTIRTIREIFQEKTSHLMIESLDFLEITENFGANKNDVAFAEQLKKPVLTNTVIQGGEQINSVPEKASAFFNARSIKEFTNDQMIQIFRDVTARDVRLSYSIHTNLSPVWTSGKSPFVTSAMDLARTYFSEKFHIGPTTGVFDASSLLVRKSEGFPFFAFGPGKPSEAHKANESIAKEEYFTFIAYYTKLFQQFLSMA